MHLKALSLKNFRNISELALTLHPKFNIFVGNNAQGKTNIIEAVYFLAFGKSFRLSDYKDLIRWNERESFIRAWVWNEIGEEERNIRLDQEKKSVHKNGKPISPNQFLSLPTVLFSPETILLLKDSPQARRDYIDDLIVHCHPSYGKKLRDYKKALAHRNKILKDEFLEREEKRMQIQIWEKPLQENGIFLVGERRKWIERLNQFLEKNYFAVAQGEKRAALLYEPNVEEKDFEEKQALMREEELDRLSTLVGPHKDKITPALDQKLIEHFGSQGELRTFTLALKMSEIELLEEVLGISPILLLDDVVSELDERRSLFFFNHLEGFKGQIFVTATSFDLFPKKGFGEHQKWELKKGAAALFK